MGGPRDDHTTEVVRQRQVTYDATQMWNLKYDTNELVYKTQTDSQIQKTNLQLPREKDLEEG